MLSQACRRFRTGFTPGQDDPHRRSCPACAAYAAALERAARKLPLPAGLRSKLRAIPGAANPAPRLPLPQAPLPDPLRDRLRGLARTQAPRPLPAWVRTSRYAVAASYVMAVLLSFTAANPAHLGRQAAERMSQAVSRTVSERLQLLDLWEDRVRERYGATRESLEDSIEESLGSLDHRVDELSRSLRNLDPLIPRRES